MTSSERLAFTFDRIVKGTDKAWLLEMLPDVGNVQEVWLPKSQVELEENPNVVHIPEWLAIEKGLV